MVYSPGDPCLDAADSQKFVAPVTRERGTAPCGAYTEQAQS